MRPDEAIPEGPPMLDGRRVFRIHWVLGTDRLRAVCHCGSERVFEDPIELWEWLLGHPVDHDGGGAEGIPAPAPREPALVSAGHR